MTKTILCSFVSIFCFSTISSAEDKKDPPFTCATIQEIDRNAEDCEGNIRFAEAGVRCLKKLEALVKKKTSSAKAMMENSNEAHVGDATNSQTMAMGGAGSNYAISIATIDALIRAGRQANAIVGNYVNNIYVPDEFALVEAGLDKDEILLGEKCYAENRETLLWVEQDIDKIIDDLEKLRAVSSSLKGGSENREARQDSSGQDPVTKGVGGGTPGKAKPGKNRGGSGISGEMPKGSTVPKK